ncbi:MAG: hypothetical protein ABFR75_10540 [Acidobacteriota bacterium]
MKFFYYIFIIFLLISPLISGSIYKIGIDDGPGEIIFPGEIKEGPDGNIYVSDYSDSFIKVYSPEGKYIRRIGGKGEGPGEMKRMGRFGFTGDKKNLFFTEYFTGHRWITFIDLSGKFKKVFKLNIKGFYGMRKAVILPDGKIFLSLDYSADVNPVKGYFTYSRLSVLVEIGPGGDIIKKIITRNKVASVSVISSGAMIEIPYQPVFKWVLLKNRIFFADGLSKRIKEFDLSGKLKRKINTHLPEPENITEKDLMEWRNDNKSYFKNRDKTWFANFGKIFDMYKRSIYKKKPNLSELKIIPGDRILIAESSQENSNIKRYSIIEPFEKAGNKKFKGFFIDLKGSGLEITGNFILIKYKDDEENNIVCCLKRGDDLKRNLGELQRHLNNL